MAEALYTLTQVSKKTGISMPTLQRYKKLYQDRIPSVGEGRTQRYPKEALAVVKEIKKENLKKRGRPPKSASQDSAKPVKKRARRKKSAAKKRKKSSSKRKTAKRSSQAPKSEGLLTLSEIGRRTGISYPTLLRYVKLHLAQIPHEGSGRRRRYPPEAVEVFRTLRASSRRGRRKGSGAKKASASSTGSASMAKRMTSLERSQARLEKRLERLIKKLSKPVRLV